MRSTDFSTTLDGYLKRLHEKLQDQRMAFVQQALFAEHAYPLSGVPDHLLARRPRCRSVPSINPALLGKAAERLRQSAKACEKAYLARAAQEFAIPPCSCGASMT